MTALTPIQRVATAASALFAFLLFVSNQLHLQPVSLTCEISEHVAQAARMPTDTAPRLEAPKGSRPETCSDLSRSGSSDTVDCLFGADPQEITGAIHHRRIRFDYIKRPAFAPTVITFVRILRAVRIREATAIALTFSVFPGATAGLLFWFMSRLGARLLTASTVVLAYVTSFGNLAVFGVPESYELTTLCLVALVISLHGGVARAAFPWSARGTAGLGAACGAAAWFHAPLLAATLVPAPSAKGRDRIRVLAIVAAVAVAVWALPLLAGDLVAGKLYQVPYVRKWASLSNFGSWHSYASVLLGFYVVGFVSLGGSSAQPLAFPGPGTDLRLWIAYAFAAAIVAGLALLLGVAVRGRLPPFVLGLLLWIGCLSLFHVYFNPREAFLYASQPVTLLVLILGQFLSERDRSESPAVAPRALLFCAIAALGVHNELTIRSPSFTASCSQSSEAASTVQPALAR